MRVAINALATQPGGGLTYLRGLLRYLPALDPAHEYLVFSAGGALVASAADNVRFLTHPQRGLLARTAWEQVVLPGVLRRRGVDVLYAPGNQGPLVRPVRFVVNIQNVDPLVPAPGLPPAFRARLAALRVATGASVRAARKVIAVSDYARMLVAGAFGTDPQAIEVIPYGAPEDAEQPLAEGAVDEVRRMALPRPYVLAVSNITHNKNYETLFSALAEAIRQLGQPVHLMVAGQVVHRWYLTALQHRLDAEQVGSYVRWLGWVNPEVLRVLYAEAAALVFPSRTESFGLPVLEAMAYGVPVTASRIPAVEEVCGDAALYFDPRDSRSMAEALVQVVASSTLRERLSAAGRLRARRFSWTHTARRTLDTLLQAAAG